ncbi:MAG TPA: hypothetical protein VF530_19925, partial [Planctomycetota bacterium]
MLLLLALLAAGPSAPQSAPPPSPARAEPAREVALAPSGALRTIPRAGLHTVDGPRVVLGEGWTEWYGVHYRDGGGPREYVGSALASDWAGRTEVQVRPGPRPDVARARAGALEVETALAREGELVVLTVTLTNRGAEELAQLFYAREWLVPGAPAWTFPPDIDDGRALPA